MIYQLPLPLEDAVHAESSLMDDLFEHMPHRAAGLRGFFAQVVQAEAMIDEFTDRHPDHRALLRDSFLAIMPTHGMHRFVPALYEGHCRELLQRVVDGEDVRRGTNAEAMVVFYEASMRAPIASTAALAYRIAWEQVLGGDVPETTGAFWRDMSEHWPGAAREALDRVKDKLGADRYVPGSR